MHRPGSSVCVCVLRCCCMRGETPVEAQMVTDGLETNQPGSQDLWSETSQCLKYVCVTVFVCICVWSVWTYMYVVNAWLSIFLFCVLKMFSPWFVHVYMLLSLVTFRDIAFTYLRPHMNVVQYAFLVSRAVVYNWADTLVSLQSYTSTVE